MNKNELIGAVADASGLFNLMLSRVHLERDWCYTTEDVVGGALWVPPGNWRLGIMQQLTLRGVARTKLAFTSDRDAERMSSPENRDIKEIYFADYDGANARRVTVSKTLNVAPAWSPDGQALAYSSWRPAGQFGTFQDVIISYIYKGVRQTPANGSPDKQNYLPAWSPDGTRVAFTLSQGGNQEIYVMNKDGSGLRRLTNNPDIDTSPTWSPPTGCSPISAWMT